MCDGQKTVHTCIHSPSMRCSHASIYSARDTYIHASVHPACGAGVHPFIQHTMHACILSFSTQCRRASIHSACDSGVHPFTQHAIQAFIHSLSECLGYEVYGSGQLLASAVNLPEGLAGQLYILLAESSCLSSLYEKNNSIFLVKSL